MADSSADASTYFATAKASEIGRRLFERLGKSTRANDEHRAFWRQAYSHYFPALEDDLGSSAWISRRGRKGELAAVKVAKNRQFARRVVGIILGSNPIFSPRAINTSSVSRSAVSLAKSVLDAWWQLRGMRGIVHRWVEQAFPLTEAFIHAPWNDARGPEAGADPNTGQLAYEGDVELLNTLPWQTARDTDANSYEESQWLAVVHFRNKWDMAARWRKTIEDVDAREGILNAAADEAVVDCSGIDRTALTEGDLVPVWYWYHKPTASLPAGREVIAVSPTCVLRDVPLSYDGIPIIRFAGAELFGTPYAYSEFLDGMGLQDLSDAVDSAMASNILTLGVQGVAVGQGSKKREPSDGLFGLTTWDVGQSGFVPQAIQLTKNPPNIEKYKEMMSRDHEQTFGLNDYFLGNPQTAQMNAQAFALLSSMAVQANNPAQTLFLEAFGQLGTSMLRTYCKRVQKERFLPLVGQGDAHLVSEASFKGDDLKGIDQVVVTAGNALEQTIPGRMQLLDLYAQHGFITAPQDIQQVVETGKIEVTTNVVRDELVLIQYENEQLSKGVNPPVHAFHDHLAHCKKHAQPVLNPQGLANPKVIEVDQQHIEDHYIEFFGLPAPIDMMTGMPQMGPDGIPMRPDPKKDPQWPVRIRLLLGQQPPPMIGPPLGDPNAPPGAPPPGAGADAGGAPPLAPPGSQGVTNGVQLPSAPENPITGMGVAGGPPGLQ